MFLIGSNNAIYQWSFLMVHTYKMVAQFSRGVTSYSLSSKLQQIEQYDWRSCVLSVCLSFCLWVCVCPMSVGQPKQTDGPNTIPANLLLIFIGQKPTTIIKCNCFLKRTFPQCDWLRTTAAVRHSRTHNIARSNNMYFVTNVL